VSDAAPPQVDLSQPVTDEDARARFALIAALLEPLIAETTGEVRERVVAALEVAQGALGATTAPGAPGTA
jgi:hypothetical protein